MFRFTIRVVPWLMAAVALACCNRMLENKRMAADVFVYGTYFKMDAPLVTVAAAAAFVAAISTAVWLFRRRA
jgi:hypothetical protein